ncbi:MAG: zf-TFIIB domain-containing protein, partial [Deltaproteobacteria bacterium]
MNWRCPSCGVRAQDPSQGYRGAQCTRCGVPLVLARDESVPIAFTCPWCQGTVDASAQRCSHCARSFGVPRCERCGAAVDLADDACRQCEAPLIRVEHAQALAVQCPVCLRPLEEQILGNGVVLVCGSCHGLFASQELLDRWTANRAADAPEGLPGEPLTSSDGRVRYRRCPRCAVWMNRVNFGPGSGIVLDVC